MSIFEQKNKSKIKCLIMTMLCLNILACSKEKISKIECPIPLTTFSDSEKEVAKKNLETKGIPVTTDSFIEAIVSKDENSINDMIKLGINLDAYGERGETPLIVALAENNPGIVTLLINKGANVNIPDQNGHIPFVKAIYGHENGTLVSYMLDHCADVNIKSMLAPPGHGSASEEVDTPLHAAIDKQDIQLINVLIKKGADINQKAGLGNISPLSLAVGSDNLELVKLFVENGANVNSSDDSGWTPLIVALENSHFEVAKFLIDHGANLNAHTTSGESPIGLAKKKSRNDIVELLLTKGAKE
ncbi:MAG: hypothetical protein HOO93_09335 [Methyloglobulus sp.]|nr:hypothetical protein [Methyloglobulus sp.]